MTPAATSHHSLSISLRSRIAPMICTIPVAIAQPAMKKRRINAVIAGHMNVSTPAPMPTRPASASHQRG
jgi:hypothetical protein